MSLLSFAAVDKTDFTGRAATAGGGSSSRWTEDGLPRWRHSQAEVAEAGEILRLNLIHERS